jgi:glycosyltransferase involved in cell wall biosynthesis
MPSSSFRAHRIRLGIVIGDNTWHFFKDIYQYLCQHFDVAVFRPKAGFSLQNSFLIYDLRDFLDQQDVAFFEWSSQLLALATQLNTRCRIVTRLHRYELFTWADKVNWERVHALIFVSSALLVRFQTTRKILPHRMVVIPPGVSTIQFHPSDSGLKYRIGTLCWLSPRKRVYELVLSFSELCQSVPKLVLSIAGGQHPSFLDYFDALQTLVARLHLSDRVEFVGQPADVSAWYRTIDVFISNSYSEGLQVALLEAMASGCYCLSHAWPGAEEVLPRSQVYCTDREFQGKLLTYYAAPSHVRYEKQERMRQRACGVFDIARVQQQIGFLLTEVMR